MNYNKVYVQLVEHAKRRNLTRKDCYVEYHHVIPSAEGGPDCKSNLVAFTAREHYIAHLLLAKIYDDAAMHSAVIYMQTGHNENRKFKFNSHLYERMRIEFGKKTSESQKGKQAGEKNPMYGKKLKDIMSPEKYKQWRKNHAEGCRKRRGLPSGMKGKHHTEEKKKQISETMKKLYWWNNGVISVRSNECPSKDFKRGRLKLSSEWKKHISNSIKGEKHPCYGRHHSKESKEKMSKARIEYNLGCHWYNDGTKEVYTKECPNGFVVGRIYRRKAKNNSK